MHNRHSSRTQERGVGVCVDGESLSAARLQARMSPYLHICMCGRLARWDGMHARQPKHQINVGVAE